MSNEVVFIPNPFIQRAGWYETPKKVIKANWVTEEYGFEVFTSANPVSRWIFIFIKEGFAIMATPEAFDDTESIRNYIKHCQA